MKFLLYSGNSPIRDELGGYLKKYFFDNPVTVVHSKEEIEDTLLGVEGKTEGFFSSILIIYFKDYIQDDPSFYKKLKRKVENKNCFLYLFGVFDEMEVLPRYSDFFNDFTDYPLIPETFYARMNMALKNCSVFEENLLLEKQNTENAYLTDHLVESLLKAVQQIAVSFGQMIQYKDLVTGAHIFRVGHIAELMAQELDISKDFPRIKYAGLFHDIGKVGIPDHVLKKPDKLTNEEFKMIQKHVEIGADIVEPIEFFEDVIDGIRFHHERWDGKGYMHGLKEEGIPLVARIISIADVFDVVVSPRPYKKALSMEEGVSEIIKHAGTQFDPKLSKVFEKLFNEGRVEGIYNQVNQEYEKVLGEARIIEALEV